MNRRAVIVLLVVFAWAALVQLVTAVPPVDQAARWNSAEIRKEHLISLDKAVFLFQRTYPRYEHIQNLRPDGVPACVLFCLHYRESDNSFSCHLHEGSPLTHRTRYVPKGRIPGIDPPYTWEQSAEDAVYICDRLQGNWDSLQWGLDKIELYNGTGYRRQGIPSPYLWSGTTLYGRGKYVEDGRFSPVAVDEQLGCAAILKRMMERGF